MRNFSVEIDIEAERDRKQNCATSTDLAEMLTNEWLHGQSAPAIRVQVDRWFIADSENVASPSD